MTTIFTFLHLHRAKKFNDAVISNKEGDVNAVGEFFNGRVGVFGDILTVEKRRKRKGIVMCV